MPTILRRLIMLAIFVVGLTGHALAGETRGTAEEAKAMVSRAIAAYDEKGDAVFAELTAPGTSFVDRDLYVFVFGPESRIVAHGGDASNVGRGLAEYTDVDGRQFATEMAERAAPDGVWVDYKWHDPLTGEVRQKSSWVVLHDGYTFGSGV